MARHKTLKSVAHNFGDSFVSLMNYIHNDYFLGHLLKQARKTNLDQLAIDILKNSAEPKELLTNPIKKSISYWTKWFPELVARSESSMDFIKSATIIIKFDLTKSRPFPQIPKMTENPYLCEVTIIDDKGKEYKKSQTGWWFPGNR